MIFEQVNEHFAKVHLGKQGVLHIFTGPELGDFHDHPWEFARKVLVGGYLEEILDLKTGNTQFDWVGDGDYSIVRARHIHKIVECSFCVTLCSYGPTVRTSRFYRQIKGIWHTRRWHDAPDAWSLDFTEYP